MNYDLPHMAWQAGLRADLEIKTRKPTQTHEDDLRRVIFPVLRHWKKQFPTLVKRSAFDAAPKEGEIEEASLASRGIVAAAIAALWRWVERLDRWARLQWVSSVRGTTGIAIDNVAPSLFGSKELSLSVAWAISLIQDLDADMKKRLQRVMIDATIRNLPQSEIVKLLSRESDFIQRRIKLIAKDQTRKIAAKMNELQQRAAGLSKYVWQHSFRKNPRMWHVRRQGIVFEWTKPPYDGHPGHAINCRCDAVALLRPQTRREVYLNG